MHDGRTFDFTQRDEGLRNTTDLRGRAGLGHGNVHWTANFDEIHDFNLDIVNHFGGMGFPKGVTPNDPLGASNDGDDPDLDDLVAYVTSLDTSSLPKSPFRDADGTMTSDAATTGSALFAGTMTTSANIQLDCASCHNPATEYTDSVVGDGTDALHNVGTVRTGSGSRMGGALNGIDTPTLLGVWNSAPYFHNGAAHTIDEVFSAAGGDDYQFEASGATNSIGAVGGYLALAKANTATIISIDGGSTAGGAAIDIVYFTNGNVPVVVEFNDQVIFDGVIAPTFAEGNGGGHPTAWESLKLEVPASAVNTGTGNTRK